MPTAALLQHREQRGGGGGGEELAATAPSPSLGCSEPCLGSLCLQPALHAARRRARLGRASFHPLCGHKLPGAGGGVVGAAAAEQRVAGLLPLCLVGCYFVILTAPW